MLKVLQDLQTIFTQDPSLLSRNATFLKINFILNSHKLENMSRDDLFQNVFLPIVKVARNNNDSFLLSDSHEYLHAICYYNRGYAYHDSMKKKLLTLPVSFLNLAEFVEKQNKFTFVEKIDTHIQKRSTKNDLRSNTKTQYLRLLLKMVLQSKTSETAADIYQQWSQLQLQYKSQAFTCRQLMKLKSSDKSVFAAKVPSAEKLCLELDEMYPQSDDSTQTLQSKW